MQKPLTHTLGLLAILSLGFMPAHADELNDDALVRLPGYTALQPELDPSDSDKDKKPSKAVRLKPGAGLFVSFDLNEDGRVSSDELTSGIKAAFARADNNGNGRLTALEQQSWAKKLHTYDDSLANPVRFDPNLDRIVDADEFAAVITNLAVDYADAETGEITLSALKAPAPQQIRRENLRRNGPETSEQRRRSPGAQGRS